MSDYEANVLTLLSAIEGHLAKIAGVEADDSDDEIAHHVDAIKNHLKIELRKV